MVTGARCLKAGEPGGLSAVFFFLECVNLATISLKTYTTSATVKNQSNTQNGRLGIGLRGSRLAFGTERLLVNK